MKIFFKKSFIVLYVFSFLSFSCKDEKVHTDYQYLIENPKGKIKSVKINCYSAEDKFGEIVKDYPQEYNDFFDDFEFSFGFNKYTMDFLFPTNSHIYGILLEFDTKGKLVEKEGFDRYGEVVSKIIATWGDNELPREIKSYDKNGDLIKRISYEYDKNDNVIMFYNSEHNAVHYRKFEKNRIVSDSMVYLADTKYNKKGEKEITEYNYSKKNGKIIYELVNHVKNEYKLICIMEYDKNDNLLLNKYFKNGNKDSVSFKIENEYDKNGNHIKRTIDDSDKEEFIYDKKNRITEKVEISGENVYRDLYFYDGNGFIIKKLEVRGYGDNETLYSYELDGNGNITRLIKNWGDDKEYFDLIECEYEYFD